MGAACNSRPAHMRWRRALAASLAVRLTVAVVIRTAFAPDEYWQSIEVAHRLVFGYGHLTWEWAAGLRSYVHPLLFAAPYAALKALRIDTPWAVLRVPLLLQALVAAAADTYVFRLAALVLGPRAARWCLVCQLASWFNAYCLARTYSNSIEAALAAAGTYYWLLSQPGSSGSSSSSSNGSGKGQRGKPEAHAAAARRQQRAWIACAAVSVVVRPSSALFWALPAGLALVQRRGRAFWALLGDAAAVGGGLLGAATVVDRLAYGRWVSVPWEFLCFNLLAGSSAQYGSHPWHWNLSQGLPTVAASLLPLLAAGLAWAGGGAARQPAWLAAWSLATYSLPAHKEFRFLLPALQLLMPYCGLAAARLLGSNSMDSGSSAGQAPAQAGLAGVRKAGGRTAAANAAPARTGIPPRPWWRWGAAACLLLQLPMAAYFLLVHQGAQVGVMGVIRREAAARLPGATSVLFLTPCHATPYYSHLHTPLPMRFLDCSPPQHAAATARLNWEEQAWLPLPTECPSLGSAGTSPAQHGEQQQQQREQHQREQQEPPHQRDQQQEPQEPPPPPSPPQWQQQREQQLSQRQCFERDPEAYLSALFGGPTSAPHQLQQRPHLLVGYAPLMGRLAAALRGYRLHSRLSNCWVQTDDDSPCELQVWSL